MITHSRQRNNRNIVNQDAEVINVDLAPAPIQLVEIDVGAVAEVVQQVGNQNQPNSSNALVIGPVIAVVDDDNDSNAEQEDGDEDEEGPPQKMPRLGN